MFSATLERIIAKVPRLQVPLTELTNRAMSERNRTLVFPEDLERRYGLAPADVLAVFGAIKELNLGRVVLRVVDATGREVGCFASRSSLPAQIEDEFGDVVTVSGENTSLVLELRPHG